jgi:hypothetical protein
VHEANALNAVIDFFHTQCLPCHDDRDVVLRSAHADAPAIGDERVPLVEGMGHSGQADVGFGRYGIDVFRALHGRCLMRPFSIEFF